MIATLPNRPSATAAAEQALRDAIVSGELAPGTKLPPERLLSKQLGISRLTLRAALATLSAAGLISVRHGSGYTVRDVRETGGTDLLPGLIANLADDATGRTSTLRAGAAAARGAADLLRLRRHLAAAVLEAIAEHPPSAAARKAVVRAIERFADATAILHAARAAVDPSAAPTDRSAPRADEQAMLRSHDDRADDADARAMRRSHDDRADDADARATRRSRAGDAGAESGRVPSPPSDAGRLAAVLAAFPGGERAVAAARAADLRAAELGIVEADLGVVRSLLDATDSMILRVCLNPIIAVLRDSAPLRAAIYAAPETNLVGWRALGVWLDKPDIRAIPVLLDVLAQRDRATVEHLRTKKQR